MSNVADLTTCLRCEGELEPGNIVGQQRFLNWEPSGTPSGRTMHGKEHLARGSMRAGPRLPASRCRECGLGYFYAD